MIYIIIAADPDIYHIQTLESIKILFHLICESDNNHDKKIAFF